MANPLKPEEALNFGDKPLTAKASRTSRLRASQGVGKDLDAMKIREAVGSPYCEPDWSRDPSLLPRKPPGRA